MEKTLDAFCCEMLRLLASSMHANKYIQINIQKTNQKEGFWSFTNANHSSIKGMTGRACALGWVPLERRCHRAVSFKIEQD